ncbi:MAG: aerotolerance regulator BatA [Bacteroidetes bacterium GWF2_49_14]|nr:MAG: aerotolerance regulator BatA [Bacteroidetes bacterium GWF2_49_14]
MSAVHFAYPDLLYLLLLLPAILTWYILRGRKIHPTVQTSGLQPFTDSPVSWKLYLLHLPIILRLGTLGLLIMVVARPQSSNSWENITTEGIDIVIALDISGSMLAEDFKPNRLEASKTVATEFISGRPDDRMGLVVFSGESFTQCPLTTDHAVLLNLFQGIQSGIIEDGTAIGLGLANSVSRLKDSEAKSKVVILLTDGMNNRGEIAPVSAADIAKTYGIRVYTVGVGSLGTAPYPFKTPFGIQYQNVKVEIDEGVLQKIASMTGGKYFRATNNEKLREIYQEIDKMEKSRIDVKEINTKTEEYQRFLWIALALLLLEIVLRLTLLKKNPE